MYKNENKINIIFNDNDSKLLKRFNEISDTLPNSIKDSNSKMDITIKEINRFKRKQNEENYQSDEVNNFSENSAYKLKKDNNNHKKQKTINYNNLIDQCRNGNEYDIKKLIKKGADVNMKDENGDTPLTISCYIEYKNSLSIIKYLIKKGADINLPNDSIDSPLICACYGKNHYSVIEYLVENKANINFKNEEGNTPLIISCQNGEIDVIKYLVNKGADIFVRNKHNQSALFMAKNKRDIVDYLKELKKDGDTLLTYACKIEDEKEVEILINNKVDVNIKNDEGNSPLSIACETRNEKIIKYLVENNANVNVSNALGNSPLITLCKMNFNASLNHYWTI